MRKITITIITFCAFLFICSCGKDESTTIKMPYGTKEYIYGDWTKESLEEHFKELGFEDVKASAWPPSDGTYRVNIFEIKIDGEKSWETDDEFKSNDSVRFKYNDPPTLRIDNNDDFETVLTSEDIDYKDFASKYDGAYVIFDGYVTEHLVWEGGTSHVIEVKGEEEGLVINIKDTALTSSSSGIDYSVEEGTEVHVEGKVSERWSKYYQRITLETLKLEKR